MCPPDLLNTAASSLLELHKSRGDSSKHPPRSAIDSFPDHGPADSSEGQLTQSRSRVTLEALLARKAMDAMCGFHSQLMGRMTETGMDQKTLNGLIKSLADVRVVQELSDSSSSDDDSSEPGSITLVR
jgi:hypothetical protein